MTIPRCLTCDHPAWVHHRSDDGVRFCESSLRHPRRCRCPRYVAPGPVPPDDWTSIIGPPPRPGIIRAALSWHHDQLRRILT